MARWSCVPASPSPALVSKCIAEGFHDRLKADPIARRLWARFDGAADYAGLVLEFHTCVRCTSTVTLQRDGD
jgi:hypothetical protein